MKGTAFLSTSQRYLSLPRFDWFFARLITFPLLRAFYAVLIAPAFEGNAGMPIQGMPNPRPPMATRWEWLAGLMLRKSGRSPPDTLSCVGEDSETHFRHVRYLANSEDETQQGEAYRETQD